MGQVNCFESGCIVTVIDCPELRFWPKCEEALGSWSVISSDQAKKLNNNEAIILFGNIYGINFTKEMLQVTGEWDS